MKQNLGHMILDILFLKLSSSKCLIFLPSNLISPEVESYNLKISFIRVDLPEPVQNYIKARAATIVSGRIVGDDDQYKRLQQQEVQQRALAMEYETSQGQFTMFGHPQDAQNFYQSYQPFHALQR